MSKWLLTDSFMSISLIAQGNLPEQFNTSTVIKSFLFSPIPYITTAPHPTKPNMSQIHKTALQSLKFCCPHGAQRGPCEKCMRSLNYIAQQTNKIDNKKKILQTIKWPRHNYRMDCGEGMV